MHARGNATPPSGEEADVRPLASGASSAILGGSRPRSRKGFFSSEGTGSRNRVIAVVVGVVGLVGVILLILYLAGVFGSSGDNWVDIGLRPCANSPVAYPDVGSMNVEEKAGQLLGVPLSDVEQYGIVATLYDKLIGAVYARAGEHPAGGLGAWNWQHVSSRIQAAAQQTRLRIPALVGVEMVHGHAGVRGATVFPHAMALGATHHPDLAQLVGFSEAKELASTGVRWALGPTLSVCRNPEWGRCFECMSENERLVRMLNSRLDGLAGVRTGSGTTMLEQETLLVLATVRFYMAAAGTMNGASGSNANMSDAVLRAMHLRPFFDAIVKGVQMVMLGDGQVNGQPIYNNSYLMSILKSQYNFQGAIVSSFDSFNDAPGSPKDKLSTLVNAGVDLVLAPPGQYVDMLEALKDAINDGSISGQRLDDAVGRVLRAKKVSGHFTTPCAVPGLRAKDTVGSAGHRQVGRMVVRKSAVLLKNGASALATKHNATVPVFPIRRRHLTFYVLGSHADDIGRQCGGYTITAAGELGNITTGTTVREGFRLSMWMSSQVVKLGPDEKIHLYGEPPFPPFTFAFIVVGEEPYSADTGDTSAQSLRLSNKTETLILDTCNKVRCVLVLVTGRPLDIAHLLPNIDALVVAWFTGTEAWGLADVILGKELDFEGTLPITWFRNPRQIPINYGDTPYNPLFPYGFGLSKNNTVLNGSYVSPGFNTP